MRRRRTVSWLQESPRPLRTASWWRGSPGRGRGRGRGRPCCPCCGGWGLGACSCSDAASHLSLSSCCTSCSHTSCCPAVSSHSCSWSRSPRPGTCCRWRSGHWSQAGSHWSLVSGHSCGSRGGGGGRLGLASRSLASLPRYTGHMGPGLGRWRSNISVRGDGVCMFVTLARDRRMRRTATWHQRWHRYHCPARTGHWGRNLCLDTHPR